METVAKESALRAEGADNFIGAANVCKIASSAAGQEEFSAGGCIGFEDRGFSPLGVFHVSKRAVNRSHQAGRACSDYANFRLFQSESP